MPRQRTLLDGDTGAKFDSLELKVGEAGESRVLRETFIFPEDFQRTFGTGGDDTLGLQKALDAARAVGNARVVLPWGKQLNVATQLECDEARGVSFGPFGGNGGDARINFTGNPSNGRLFSWQSSYACSLYDLDLYVLNQAFTGSALNLEHSGSGADVGTFRAERLGVFGIDVNSLHTAVLTGFLISCVFDECAFSWNNRAVENGGGPLVVRDTLFNNAFDTACLIGGQSIRFTGCTWEPNTTTRKNSAMRASTVRGLTILGCWTGDSQPGDNGTWFEFINVNGAKVLGCEVGSNIAGQEVFSLEGSSGVTIANNDVLADAIVRYVGLPASTTVGVVIGPNSGSFTDSFLPAVGPNVLGQQVFDRRGRYVYGGADAIDAPFLEFAGGANHNVPLVSNNNIVFMNPNANFSVSGFRNGRGGMRATLVNRLSVDMTLLHQNAGSTAGNRIVCPGAVDLLIPAAPVGGSSKAELLYLYDTPDYAWYVL